MIAAVAESAAGTLIAIAIWNVGRAASLALVRLALRKRLGR